MPDPKPVSKESLKAELTNLLVTAHGDIKQAAEKIAKAVDALIKKEGPQSKEMLIIAISQAMSIPKSPYFKVADGEVKQALMNILEHAKEVIDKGLNDPIALNEYIKQEQKKLKERIHHIEEENRKRGLSR